MGIAEANGYLDTVDRLELNIHPVDPGAFYASAAISLKRIADALERKPGTHIEWVNETIRKNASQSNAYVAIKRDALERLAEALLIASVELRNREGHRVLHRYPFGAPNDMNDPMARAAVVLAAFLGQPEPVVVLPDGKEPDRLTR